MVQGILGECVLGTQSVSIPAAAAVKELSFRNIDRNAGQFVFQVANRGLDLFLL